MFIDRLPIARKLLLLAALPLAGLLGVAALAYTQQATALAEFRDLAFEDAPMGAGVASIDGDLMDQQVEYQKARRVAQAVAAGDPAAPAALAAMQAEFSRLADVSSADFAKVQKLLDAAAESDDPEVVATYQGLAKQLREVDELQTRFEGLAREALGTAPQAARPRPRPPMCAWKPPPWPPRTPSPPSRRRWRPSSQAT